MSLRVQRGTGSRINKLLFGFVAVFALIAQPMYGLVASQVAEAASLDVCTSGCVYTTIQSAINAAAAGDTITVAAGTYSESLSITKKVILVGAAGATIQGQPASEYAINITGGSAVNETSISGFNIVAAAGKVGLKVDKTGVDKLNVANNNFSGGSRLAYIGGATNSTFTNNTFNVAGNTVASVYVAGVPSNGAGAVTPSANIWSGNTFTGATTQLAFGSEASNSQFTNNNLTGLDVSIKDKIVEFLGTNNTASGNTFNPAQPAISVYGSGVDYKGTFTTFGKTLSVTGAGATIVLESDISTNTQVTINQSNVTFNGNNKTLKNNRDNSVKDNSNNSAIGIQANGVTVNNLTIDGADGQWMHGINAYEATGVNLNQVTLKNNTNSGLVVGKDSNVTVTDITTVDNGWNGINVDKSDGTSATLTVKGVSTHNEDATAHIWIDNRNPGTGTVNDPNAQYARYWEGNGYKYLLDRTKPTAELTVAPFNPSSFDIKATDDQRLTRIDYSLWEDNDTTQVGVWGHTVDWNDRNSFEKTFTQYCDHGGDHNDPCVVKNFTSDLDEGTYQLRAIATDVMGKQTNAVTREFTVDKTAPSAPEFKVDGKIGSFYTNLYNPTASWNQPSPDTVKYEYNYCNDIAGDTYNCATKSWGTTLTDTSRAGGFTQGEGVHHMKVRAIDAAGNVSDWSNVVTVTYDKTVPTSQIDSHNATGNSLTFTGEVEDVNLNYYYCYLTTNQTITVDGHTFTAGQEVRLNNNADSSRNTACGTTWANGTTEFDGTLGGFNITNVPDGSYTINLVAYDLAGNNNAASPETYNFTIDRTPATGGGSGGGGSAAPRTETPVLPAEPSVDTPTLQSNPIAFLPATLGAINSGDDAVATPLLRTTPSTNSDDSDADVLGAEDVRTDWSVVNAALAGFIAILAVVALAGIRRTETDNNTGARVFMLVPAAAAVIAFFLIEDIGGSMAWFNVWTWLFAGILVVQAILATLTTRTAND